MYHTLVFFHSLFRWLVLASLLSAILLSYRAMRSGRQFTLTDDRLRHWTATIAHMQLMIGVVLYFTSPLIKVFFAGSRRGDLGFFGMIHASLMLAAIVVITIGSALAKRKQDAKDKFRTMLVWFAVALLVILIAIPWPFSPLASRPLYRTF